MNDINDEKQITVKIKCTDASMTSVQVLRRQTVAELKTLLSQVRDFSRA